MAQLQFLLIFLVLLCSCTQEIQPSDSENQGPEVFLPKLSSSLGVVDFPQPERNPMTQEGVLLGKKLFFDPLLSSNGKVSCATCHQPQKAFTDGTDLSTKGVSGKSLHRHSPPLFNLAWHTGGLFWDGGAKDLESLNFGPLTHPDEMAADLKAIAAYLASDPEYPKLFEKAFGSVGIQSATISRALSQYTRTLISQTSRYDAWKKGIGTLSTLELKGYTVFRQHCESCHREGLFTDLEYHNNGLDLNYPNPPELEGLFLGRFRVTLDSADMGAYKTASLRNITLTAPYMHDGRFTTLDEVLDHYASGIKVNGSVAPQLKAGIQLSPEERRELIAFLQTLQDDEFVNEHQQDFTPNP